MMQFDAPGNSRNALDRLKARIREGTAQAYTLAYFDHRTLPNLVQLLEEAAVPEAEAVLGRLRACGRYHPCRMYTCPICGPKLKAREKDAALKRIVQRLGRFPKGTEISFVTLRGPTVELNLEAAQVALDRFWRRIVRFRHRHSPGTSWLGYFDVSLNGMVHWHGLVLHPEMPRSALETHLTGSFGEDDQVIVSQWKTSQSLVENLQAVLNYALVADRHAKVFTRMDGPDRQRGLVHGSDVLARVAKRIVVMQALTGRGVQGTRRAIDMKPTSVGIVVRELETLVRRTKKRINTKSMPNREWAPRGVYGTQRRGKKPN